MALIKVLVVDDHELVRKGITRILADAPGIKVVGEAGSGEEAFELVKRTPPDVVLMDVNMPGMGGVEATRKLAKMYPHVRIVAVTVHMDEPVPSRLLEVGAAGYLTKGCAVEEIIKAIHAVHKGEQFICRDIAQQIAVRAVPRSRGGASPFLKLSQRELQVMLMVIQGVKTQDISDRLNLSPKTVSTYRSRLFEKLRVQSDVELTHLAMRYGVVDSNLAKILKAAEKKPKS